MYIADIWRCFQKKDYKNFPLVCK